MSRPGGPYRDERYPPQQRQYPQDGYQQGYPQQGYPDQGYTPDRGQGYGQGYGADQGYGYGQQQEYRPQHSVPERPRPTPEPEYQGGGFRLPGLGLLFSLLGLIVQVASLFFLPWLTAGGDSAALPEIWDAVRDIGTGGFTGAYVLLFSYPLAVLGILLSLVAVLQSVAMKVIWAILTIIGLAVLVLRYGLGPFGEMVSSDKPLEFSSKEITLAIVALAALALVIFMLKMAMSTFRIVGGIVLLVCAGVHVAAMNDMTGGGFEGLGIGAYGPAAGYVLAALAAFIGPRKIA
jgi:hypothetical protein